MRNLLILIGVGLLSSIGYAQPAAWTEYTEAQKLKWSSPDSELLNKKEKKKFEGVQYFEYDKTLRISAIYKPLKKAPVEIPTTNNTVSKYQAIALAIFSFQGKYDTLTVYKGLDEWSKMDKQFVMFNDATNGVTTYEGGRYVELQEVDSFIQLATLDFNYSYNPYCAYSDRYSCPIPPKENRLEFEVKAGAKY